MAIGFSDLAPSLIHSRLLHECRNGFNYASGDEDGSADGKRKGNTRYHMRETQFKF